QSVQRKPDGLEIRPTGIAQVILARIPNKGVAGLWDITRLSGRLEDFGGSRTAKRASEQPPWPERAHRCGRAPTISLGFRCTASGLTCSTDIFLQGF
ncbi:MAG: hypothetical protein K2R98_14895, partial [Gemmataceae bacterium]|nr:hypothetical protein [Gemmataceae bacterium]